jgi:hypothetical protein
MILLGMGKHRKKNARGTHQNYLTLFDMLPILNLTEIIQVVSETNKCIDCTNRDTLLGSILFKQKYRVRVAQYDFHVFVFEVRRR